MVKRIVTVLVLIGLSLISIPLLSSRARADDQSPINQVRIELAGPPWFDGAWNYRRPIVITNNGASLPYYQVLIKLESSNFNFSLAKANGADLRFTHSDGTTELRYWIESWDSINQRAYMWVRVPNIPTGSMTIYMYYNNPDATSVSSGTTTFDGFDDNWSQFTGELLNQGETSEAYPLPGDINSLVTWSVISGSPDVTSGVLSLMDGDGIKSTATYLYYAMGMRAKFSTGNGYEWGGFINGENGKRTMIGDLPSDVNNLYLLDYRDSLEKVLIQRNGGVDWHNTYHVYEVQWNPTQSKADIDHGARNALSTQPGQVPNTSLPVTLYSYTGSNATLMVDWVYVRQYRDPEPTPNIGAEQGLVKLGISDHDSPDPVRNGRKLTYQIIATNTSGINALGVVMTDTLPANVQLGPISTSQGSCTPGNVIRCDLNTINANSQAWVTVNVTPTIIVDYLTITNTTELGSLSFELDLSDNTVQQGTLVDSLPPVVNWQGPVQNKGTYFSSGGPISLEATALDNDQVVWVEFKLWDHDPLHKSVPHWVIIGRDDTYPYQVQFDTDLLVPNQAYQTFVYASDRAGNQSDPYDPLQRIFIGRRIQTYLPTIRK